MTSPLRNAREATGLFQGHLKIKGFLKGLAKRVQRHSRTEQLRELSGISFPKIVSHQFSIVDETYVKVEKVKPFHLSKAFVEDLVSDFLVVQAALEVCCCVMLCKVLDTNTSLSIFSHESFILPSRRRIIANLARWLKF